MRNDSGINGDAQRIEQISWMLFLKVYDAKEQDWEFDEEDYSKGKQFFRTKDDPPSAELAELVRKRGRQVFEAVFRAYPDMMFHSSWLFSTIQKWHAWVVPEFGLDQAALAAAYGELWGVFMNGAIDAMPPEATIAIAVSYSLSK